MNLIVEVRRDLYTPASTQGRMAIDGVPECFTLEPPEKKDGTKPRCIPCGTYPLTIRWSFDHHRHLPHVESVPGFTAIEQHIGNTSKDTLACTLLGKVRGPQPDFIGQSLIAFTAVMTKYLDAAELTNPEASEKEQIWRVGAVTYTDARTA
jgi:hypothetical protein